MHGIVLTTADLLHLASLSQTWVWPVLSMPCSWVSICDHVIGTTTLSSGCSGWRACSRSCGQVKQVPSTNKLRNTSYFVSGGTELSAILHLFCSCSVNYYAKASCQVNRELAWSAIRCNLRPWMHWCVANARACLLPLNKQLDHRSTGASGEWMHSRLMSSFQQGRVSTSTSGWSRA